MELLQWRIVTWLWLLSCMWPLGLLHYMVVGSQQPVAVTLCRSHEAGESDLSKGTVPPWHHFTCRLGWNLFSSLSNPKPSALHRASWSCDYSAVVTLNKNFFFFAFLRRWTLTVKIIIWTPNLQILVVKMAMAIIILLFSILFQSFSLQLSI